MGMGWEMERDSRSGRDANTDAWFARPLSNVEFGGYFSYLRSVPRA